MQEKLVIKSGQKIRVGLGKKGRERGKGSERDSRCCVCSAGHGTKFTPLSVAGDNGNSSRQVRSAANLAGDSSCLTSVSSNRMRRSVLPWHWQ